MYDETRSTGVYPPAPPDGLVDRLLRSPEAIFARLDRGSLLATLMRLTALAIGGHTVYGLVVGSFSGQQQWWVAPVKAVAGSLLCVLICFPSLYIFASLGEAVAHWQQVLVLGMAQLALTGLLLAGFAPIAWVFSQSSQAVSFVGAVHLIVWVVSVAFAQRVVSRGALAWGAERTGLLNLWSVLFLITALQMTTALRPFVGTADDLLPAERKFFMQHWADSIWSDMRGHETPR